MNNEAVEYVRGVPVVKTFGQTVHSFKQFKGTIDSYYDFVMSYCKKCRPSMLSYTVLVNSAFAFLIVMALILTGGGPVAQPVLLNFIFYVIFTPIIATAMTKVMFMSENGMIVEDAMSRIHSILDVEPLPEPRSGKVPTDHDIALENVAFRYTGGTTDALHDVTIRVGAGETVALVGPSSGGKTTVAGLISRFWDVAGGSIQVGDERSPQETIALAAVPCLACRLGRRWVSSSTRSAMDERHRRSSPPASGRQRPLFKGASEGRIQ